MKLSAEGTVQPRADEAHLICALWDDFIVASTVEAINQTDMSAGRQEARGVVDEAFICEPQRPGGSTFPPAEMRSLGRAGARRARVRPLAAWVLDDSVGRASHRLLIIRRKMVGAGSASGCT